MEVIAAKVLFIEAFRKPQCRGSCQKEIEQENNGGEGERVRARGCRDGEGVVRLGCRWKR